MGSQKRKRESMDSAIADMSSDDSSLSNSGSPFGNSGTQLTEVSSMEDSQSKRVKSNRSAETFSLSIRDYGTAASQRPRRGASPQLLPANPEPSTPPKQNKSLRRRIAGQLGDKLSTAASQAPADKAIERVHMHMHEVNGNNAEHEQTPQQDQSFTELPTPPQTVKKTNTQAIPQSSLRRSTRERRPTECSQQPLDEEITPRAKRTNKKPQTEPGDRGSFIYRQKQRDDNDTHESREQSASFVDNGSLQPHDSGPFAQPRPEPILADSQDFDSSQARPDEEDFHAAAHIQELQGGSVAVRERFSTSQWISRQAFQRPVIALTPDTSPRRPDYPHGSPSMVPNDAAINNNSWQTQPTMPWFPSWNAPSPGGTQQEPTAAKQSFYASQATTVDEEPGQFPSPSGTGPLNKQYLYDIADQLSMHRTLGSPKPKPAGQPPVWADGRMELCETLHYFRSYQSASYSTGGFARGFMFDKVAHPRDYIDSNVVIARASGGQVKDKNSGEMRANRDQVEDTTSNNLRNCMNHYNPVVIITGVDNPHMPSQPPYQYCVLDYFKPTHIWTEKSGTSKIVRYRFEKLNARKESWWRPRDVEDHIELGSLPPPFIKSCGTCARKSLQIYLDGWMCLQPTCGSFWLILPSGPDSPRGSEPFEPDEASMVYDPRFLKGHTPWPNDDHEYSLTSNDASLSDHSIPGENTSEAFIRGLVCPLCGRCNSRVDWSGWECQNATCEWKRSPPHTLIPAVSLREPLWPLTYSYTLSRDTHSPLITANVSFAHNYRINRHTIPGIDGFITHMVANRAIAEEPNGPDSMYEELQQTDIGLRRRLIDNSQLKGGTYTRNFLVNYGMPYKFIAATASHPFSSAARPITATRSRLNWAAKYLLSHGLPHSPSSTVSTSNSSQASRSSIQFKEFEDHEFNEVLALGYFESQKISYHDDGEFGLGPTIATLSLGAPGTMRIRLKAKHHLGVSAAGVYTDALPLPGSNNYTARLAVHDDLQALKSSDPKSYRKRLKELPREMNLGASGNAKDVLKMEVGHGDVVVMHGAQLQRYYEHAVEHSGKLRFALTCRYIDPESLGEGGKPSYLVERDQGGYDGAVLEQRGGGSALDHTLT
ncbi:hypothetical protein ST47_g2755 [Ascochyta rabiei]|uniref:Fe2OG dioxygenase domain-containing protein n=1 Tax=Didymella rabiei TaxID=5454 RepID=A0A163J2A7_DIDRA|nr:hypothetical protein ST47_g2755 [Ascochyta rabiei]